MHSFAWNNYKNCLIPCNNTSEFSVAYFYKIYEISLKVYEYYKDFTSDNPLIQRVLNPSNLSTSNRTEVLGEVQNKYSDVPNLSNMSSDLNTAPISNGQLSTAHTNTGNITENTDLAISFDTFSRFIRTDTTVINKIKYEFDTFFVTDLYLD
jgi:hypothetical protein